MNKGIKYLAVASLAAACAIGTYAGNIEVDWSANDVTGVSLANTYIGVPNGSLMEIGIFSGAFVAPTLGQSSLANFTAFATSTTQGSEGDLGEFNQIKTIADDAGFATKQIYMVFFDAPTQSAATQMGVFYYTGVHLGAGNAGQWVFQSSSDLDITSTIDVEGILDNPGTVGGSLDANGHIVYGDGVTYNPSTKYSMVELQAIVPEPSSITLVVVGLLGAFGMIRRRR
jgi:hypothetical protein